jgi:hypothetical protein
MSAQATSCLQSIKSLYFEAGNPETKTWYFYPGRSGADLDELAKFGLVFKILGTPHGFAWRLSDEGVRQVRALP